MSIQVNLEPLETTSAFPYLVRVADFNNSGLEAMYGNMMKTQRQWGMMAKVLTKTGETVRARAMIYKSVVKTMLLY